MTLLKTRTNILLLFILCLFSENSFSLTAATQCGNYLVGIDVLLDSKKHLLQHQFYYVSSNHKRHSFYDSEAGSIVDAQCVQNTNDHLILFQETCGGNGCPEDIYDIYNLNNKKLLLNPRDWPQGNIKEAEQILGDSLAIFKESNNFCCTKESRKLIQSYLSAMD